MPQRCVHILISKHTTQHANIAKQGGDNNTLDNNQSQNAPRLCTNSLTDSKLVGALLNGDEHDITYAHDTREQCEESDDPKESMDDIYSFLHLLALSIVIPYPDAAIILRVNLVHTIQSATIVLLKGLVGILRGQSLERKLDAAQTRCIGAINTLDRSVRRIGSAITFATALVDANNLERDIAHLDILAQQRFIVLRFQLLSLVITEHNHLTAILQVDIVNESAA